MDKEERRKLAFEKGKKIEAVCCPLCLRAKVGKIVPFKTLSNPEVVQVRYHIGGRGIGGFFKNEAESIRLKDLLLKRPEVYNNIKEEVTKLHELFK